MPNKTGDYADWLTKPEAAQALQCGEKTIERLAAKGQIHQAFRRMPGRRPIAVFHPKDIEKLKANTAAAPAFVQTDATQDGDSGQSTALVPVAQGPADFITALASAWGKPSRLSIDKKLFLTIPEAAEYSGLPKTHLRKMIKEGKLPSIKAGGHRVKRSELEKLG